MTASRYDLRGITSSAWLITAIKRLQGNDAGKNSNAEAGGYLILSIASGNVSQTKGVEGNAQKLRNSSCIRLS